MQYFFQVNWVGHTWIFVIFSSFSMPELFIVIKRVNWKTEDVNDTEKNCFKKF